MPAFSSRLATARAWVDPESLPTYLDAADVAGNVPQHIKQLALNTLGAYGIGDTDCFAHTVGRRIRIVDMSHTTKGDKLEVVSVAEIQACQEMLNGAGTVHGGCLCYLVDNCAAFPLVVIGLMQDSNGVGVTQAMHVFFHAPASIDTCLRVTSTSVSFGGRIMSSRCEVSTAHTPCPRYPFSLSLSVAISPRSPRPARCIFSRRTHPGHAPRSPTKRAGASSRAPTSARCSPRPRAPHVFDVLTSHRPRAYNTVLSTSSLLTCSGSRVRHQLQRAREVFRSRWERRRRHTHISLPDGRMDCTTSLHLQE
ncbi:hypothetical protein C2E23DRAFT_845872 [Lenzites betulinus]|nr:hypothetical protein C2E23DRAFT_845872 [Lenzites betulinus]